MNDTVKRLMGMIENYGLVCKLGLNQAESRQALEAELVRLFTPLSDEQILEKWMDGRVPVLNFAREIEACHGIGVEQNQCDGCMAGQAMRGALHIDSDGKALMVCQKSKYGITGGAE